MRSPTWKVVGMRATERSIVESGSKEDALRRVLDIEHSARAIIEDAEAESKRLVVEARAKAKQMQQEAERKAQREADEAAEQGVRDVEEATRAIHAEAERERAPFGKRRRCPILIGPFAW